MIIIITMIMIISMMMITIKAERTQCMFHDLMMIIRSMIMIMVMTMMIIRSMMMMIREHNRVVEELRGVNPQWDGDRLYQEGRKVI